jgi:hypothetical protein
MVVILLSDTILIVADRLTSAFVGPGNVARGTNPFAEK